MPNQTPIKNVVVLMMENHSFDHMLGWIPGIGNLEKNKYYNLDIDKNKIYATPGAQSGNNHCDPNHDHPAVINQLYGDNYSPPGGNPSGEYFVQNNYAKADIPAEEEYMRCYDEKNGLIPNLVTLAKNFITCNRWFSSVPGPTGPNRLFTHCASSGSYAGGHYSATEFQNSIPLLTIFELIDKKNFKNGWTIYTKNAPSWKGGLCTAKALKYVQQNHDNVKPYSQFAIDVKDDNLPRYSFIVPSLIDGTSQHPTYGPVTKGDYLMGQVYNTIRFNKTIWENTVFVITYDEHGGYYDSVNPIGTVPAPKVINGTSWICGVNPPFDFRTLGVRVPAIIISPWFDATVDSNTYEHSSITATLINLLDLEGPVDGFLTERDMAANDFLINQNYRSTPRTDIGML